MSNKEKSNCDTKEKEAEHKQFAKPGSKSDSHCASESKPDKSKAKADSKECGGMSDEDECEE